MIKKCTKCKEEKPISAFGKCKSNKDGYMYRCKQCYNNGRKVYRKINPSYKKNNARWQKDNAKKNKDIQKKWWKANKEKSKEYRVKWNKANPGRALELSRKWAQTNPDKIINKSRKWKEANPDKVKELQHRWNKKNTQKIRDKNKKFNRNNPDYGTNYYRVNSAIINAKTKQRRQNNQLYNLSCKLRSLVSKAFKKQKYTKNSSTMLIVGIDFPTVQQHLISTFEMNYCIEWRDEYVDMVHIDHIYPISRATTEKELRELNHYSNLQYLFSTDNLEKGDNINFTLQGGNDGN